MSDEIKQRLQDSTEACVKSYEAWRKDEKNNNSREALQEAVHEIRKVASRLEIELAVSERDQMAQNPMPIPQNRNARGRNNKNEGAQKPAQKPEVKKDAPKKDLSAGFKPQKSKAEKDAPKEEDKKAASGE